MTVIAENSQMGLVLLCGLLLLICSLYCILVTTNLIRVLIGVELISKALTLLIIGTGYFTGQGALAEALVITLIVVEVVAVAVAAGVIIGNHRHTQSLNAGRLQNLKG